MQVEITTRSSSSIAQVSLDKNETIMVESGAMIAMSPDIDMKTEAQGGVLESVSRSVFSGESFFLNTYTGKTNGDRILLAPPLPGDIAVVNMQNQSLLVQSGSYLASSAGIEVDMDWTGFETFFSGYGLIMLRARGTGTLIVSSCGSIHFLELNIAEKFIVDTAHLVTFEEQVGYDIKKVAGWKSTLFSGEGLVIELTGPGNVTLQSHNQESFLSKLIHSIPKEISVGNSGDLHG